MKSYIIFLIYNILDSSEAFKIDDVLCANVAKLESNLKSESEFHCLSVRWESDKTVVIPHDCSPKWRFVLFCLKALHLLRASIHDSLEAYTKTNPSDIKPIGAPKMSPDTLSFSEQKVVKGALQFIVCLGICPNLHKGVGIPLELRSGFGALVGIANGKENVTDKETNLQLYQCVKVLLSTVASPALGTMILTQHLVDILAALFQLTYLGKHQGKFDTGSSQENHDSTRNTEDIKSFKDMNPASVVDFVRSKFDENKPTQVHTENVLNIKSSSEHSNRRVESQDESSLLNDGIDFRFCEEGLEELLRKIYPPLLVKTLLLLQGGPKTKVTYSV